MESENNKENNKMLDDNKMPDNRKNESIFSVFFNIVITVIILNLLMSFFSSNRKIKIYYNQFIELVESGSIDTVDFDNSNGEINFILKKDIDGEQVMSILQENNQQATNIKFETIKSKVFFTPMLDNPNIFDVLLKNDVKIDAPTSNKIVDFIWVWIFPMIIIWLIFKIFSNILKKASSGAGGLGGGMGGFSNMGKSNAKLYDKESATKVTFDDVAGLEEAKESLIEMVDFLKNPEKYEKIGAKLPKGALLVGPPGTGKTMLAKALAGESGVPFFSLSGSEFVEMIVGVGAKRVRSLFEEAKQNSPCIIFIDELDAIGKTRDNQIGGNDEREQTLNQLLVEMDGFSSQEPIIVLAATNRPEILDKALLRPGRFDRRVVVDTPDLNGRVAILKVHSKGVTLADDVDLKQMAFGTSGASGADLANMINEAALYAVRNGREEVTQADLMESIEMIIAGKEMRDRILSEKERKIVSYHEVGHALAAALQEGSQPVQKITIVPRTMGSLGYTMQMPQEEKYLYTKGELLEEIVVLVSGRAAEQIIFGEISTGASNDIERATGIARNMVTVYGMSESFNMMALENVQNQYLDGNKSANYSETTGAQIDLEVKGIIEKCYNKSIKLLTNNEESLHKISKYLHDKETITGVEFMEILEGDLEVEGQLDIN